MPFTLIFTFDVTIPAGTLPGAPLVTRTPFGDTDVDRIEWLFPDGCNGVVGIQVGARAVPVFPKGAGQWLIRSGDAAGTDLDGMHTTGDWSVIGYNAGAYPHTIHVTFHARRHQARSPAGVLIIDRPDLTGTGDS